MDRKDLLLGPILVVPRYWKRGCPAEVAALIGLQAGAQIPEFQVGSRYVPAPQGW
jgi:hypothetical protein